MKTETIAMNTKGVIRMTSKFSTLSYAQKPLLVFGGSGVGVEIGTFTAGGLASGSSSQLSSL
jgi:hypothetical protein